MRKHRVKKWIESRTLTQKFMTIILALCAVLCVGESMARRVAYRAYNEQLYVKTAQVLTSCAEQIQLALDKVNLITMSVIGDNGIQESLMTLRDEQLHSEPWREASKTLDMRLSNLLYRNDIFQAFGIQRADGTFNGMRIYNLSQSYEELFAIGRADEGALRFLTVDGQLLVLREIRQTKGLALTDLGVMVGFIDVPRLLKQVNAQYVQVGVELAMSVYMNGECLYDGGGGLPMAEDGWQIDGDEFVVQCGSGEWRYVVRTPYGEIRESIRSADRRSTLLTVLVAAAALWGCFLVVRRIIHHLDVLLQKMDDYRRGVLPDARSMQRYAERGDEIGRLHRHFDRMAAAYKKLTDENYNRMILLKETQYRQLQAQIQPHFLFNTLSSIVWSAYRHGDGETAELTNRLSRVLRASIAGSETTVPLADECALVQDYMAIQQARWGDRLQYSVELGNGLARTRLPRMTLQPIVENAIRHGLEQILEPCRIRITAVRAGSEARITVENNGSEIPPDLLAQLESGAVQPSGTGVGLRNIHRRIQLAFSEEYGLRFASAEGKTRVTVAVPAESEDKPHE